MYLIGNFFYISLLLINAIAILSEDRFLARINLSPSSYDPAFGAGPDASIKAKIINLIASVRTLMRSTQFHLLLPDLARKHPSCLRAHVVPPGCVGPYAPPMGEGGKWGIQDSNPTGKEETWLTDILFRRL
ncbi:hypothetical protein ACRALDRAFT_207894 [Sodiomyces alcalophilus JCM 7366]|uniref:uncharacterized protein n=1 Tax=Sodiomyces alcalophilus JCM 7366 TaxID=591952 RepID=UPI0039B5AD36